MAHLYDTLLCGIGLLTVVGILAIHLIGTVGILAMLAPLTLVAIALFIVPPSHTPPTRESPQESAEAVVAD